TYSPSKAALYSATQVLRAELKPQGISVHAVFPGPVDTDMTKDSAAPKTSPEAVARSIFDAIAAGVDDIFPDEAARAIGAQWLKDPKAVERTLSSMFA